MIINQMGTIKFQLTPSRRATPGPGTHSPIPHHFNSRPHGGRHFCTPMECNIINISTHALTEGDNIIRKYIDVSGISTHALTEGDKRWAYQVIRENISTHALTEGDRDRGSDTVCGLLFQLTPSRRATLRESPRRQSRAYFNSRPHGGRPPSVPHFGISWYISTHALTEGDCSRNGSDADFHISTHALTEGDTFGSHVPFEFGEFQLTPSRRATKGIGFLDKIPTISTHALTEGDNRTPGNKYGFISFQLTPSRRATQQKSAPCRRFCHFNSRPHGGRRQI